MNRIIKFRAINNSGNILIGDLIQFEDVDKYFIIPNNLFFCDVIIGIDIEKRLPIIDLKFEVLKDTIGQCTGLADKNGVEIFEGDIIVFKYKLSFFSNLMQNYAELKNLNSINGISYSHSKKHPLRFCYIIENCPFTGIWIKNLHSDYKEPLFTIHKELFCDLETLEVVGNIHQNKDLLNEQ